MLVNCKGDRVSCGAGGGAEGCGARSRAEPRVPHSATPVYVGRVSCCGETDIRRTRDPRPGGPWGEGPPGMSISPRPSHTITQPCRLSRVGRPWLARCASAWRTRSGEVDQMLGSMRGAVALSWSCMQKTGAVSRQLLHEPTHLPSSFDRTSRAMLIPQDDVTRLDSTRLDLLSQGGVTRLDSTRLDLHPRGVGHVGQLPRHMTGFD